MNAQIADHYQWKNRVLLLFAPTEYDPALQQQLSILTQKLAEVTDRDLVFYKIFSETGTTPDGKTLLKAQTLAFRQNYIIEKDGFTLILVGKDGTEKLRERAPVPAAKLFDLIDRMPMSKAERKKSGN